MGLPVRQRRVLERIENMLHGSDPRLAALYGIFAKLTRDEEMPRREQLRHNATRMMLRLQLALALLWTRLFGRLVPRHRGMIFFPLAVGAAVVSIIFAAKASSGPECGQLTQTSAVAGHAHAAKLCKGVPAPLGFAH